jgi:hypothetical protein
MSSCVALLKEDVTLFASDEVVDFLSGQPKLRAFLRAVLAKKT